MWKPALCLLLVGPLCACAMTPDRRVEAGVPIGSPGLAAIDRGDLSRAERLLEQSALGRDDPARLINLGYVYLEQGRRDDALKAWQDALDARRHRWVETYSGREVRTDQLAREVLARYRPAIASAD
jgi:tetratricopeptide (TPR) repeat protein